MSESKNTLALNLSLLDRHDPELSKLIAQSEPNPDFQTLPSKAGPLVATVQHNNRPIALSSKYDPLKEAARIADRVDLETVATVVAVGLGLGYHIDEISKRIGMRSLLVVWEPDLSTLRSTFEQFDFSAWLLRKQIVLLHGQMDRAAILARLERHYSILTQGLQFIEHPTYRQTHPQLIVDFTSIIRDVVASARTSIATSLVNSARTCQNLASNLGQYAAGASINELKDRFKGYPAVCVAAGPSLVKNVHLLQDSQVRNKIVVIAVQTALRPLLDRGIKPDFVTALDYSQISARFYENLPPLPDVTLIAEPKAHCTILDDYPGPIRILQNQFNDLMLGEHTRPMDSLPSGGTVAHLSFYVAQYLGCDPIMLIGQDLGFSNGLYYAPGTAVHQVWSSEFNQFNTVEMMEWIRVSRMQNNLRKIPGAIEDEIYTDEQMATYLKQFERDFSQAPQTILDTTEGGAAKEHTTVMTFADAIKQYATKPIPSIPLPSQSLDLTRLKELFDMVNQRIADINELRKVTNQSIAIIQKMINNVGKENKMLSLYKELTVSKQRVEGDLQTIFNLVMRLNVIGTYKRDKRDRMIDVNTPDNFHDKQRMQLERDAENLDWIVQSSDESLDIFAAAQQRIEQTIANLTNSEELINH